jgi:hypothetical protein
MLHRILCIAAAGAALACAKTAGRPASAATTGASASAAESTAQSIAVARCDREQACKNLGRGKKFTSRNVCVDELRDKTQRELRSSECEGGVDSARLDTCLSEIRAEKCASPLPAVTRLTACRTTALCGE